VVTAAPVAVVTAAPSAEPIVEPAVEPPAPMDLAIPAGVTAGVVHRSETYATMVARAGKVVRTLSLVTTSDVPLSAGTRGLLMRKVPAGEGEDGSEWAALAMVVVKKVDMQANLELTIEEERPTTNKKARPYARGTAVKLRVDRVE
jgi:hypothetical protein